MPNVWNQDKIADYLRGFSEGNEKLAGYLIIALHRALMQHKDNLHKVRELPQNAPVWMQKKWPEGGPWMEFVPDDQLNGRVRHVADWLKAAMSEGEAWLDVTDNMGRPRKLLHIGSLREALDEADKTITHESHEVPPEKDGDTREIMQLDDSFRIVQLLTPAALDRETAMTGHCIGRGAYDDRLASGRLQYFSLRDRNNIAHATFEVDVAGHALMQCKGLKDRPPAACYMPYVKSFVGRERYSLSEAICETGLMLDAEGHYQDIYHLPENLCVEGNFDLRNTAITFLPDGLNVTGYVFLQGTHVTVLPRRMHVGHDLFIHLTGITEPPEDLIVKGKIIGGRWCSGIADARRNSSDASVGGVRHP